MVTMSNRWRGSLGLRLLVGTLCWVVLSVAAAGWGLSSLFSQHVLRQFHAELGTHLDQLAANLVFDDEGAPRLRAALSDPRLARPYSGLYWQVDRLGDDGDRLVVLRSRSLWDGVLLPPEDAPADGEIHVHRLNGPDGARVYLIEQALKPEQFPGLILRLSAAANEALIVEPVKRFNGLLVVSLVILSVGLMGAAIVQLRIALAPMTRLRGELASVREGRAAAIEGRFPSEIQPLVDEFNGVLANNAEVVARARTQAGNLAHAVKTPLAILANAARTQDGPLARTVLDQARLAQTQVEHHLARARAAAAVGISGHHVMLRPVLEALVRTMQRLHAERGHTIELLECPPLLAFRGEEQDLQEMLGNLLDNACKWAAHSVAVSATAQAGQLVIAVEDDGPGLSSAERAAVFGRGVRADEQQPGSGLGLAIVRDLAQLYGGEIVLEGSPRGGLRACLRLPLA